jgi:hypothetical protein
MNTEMGIFIGCGYGSHTGIDTSTLLAKDVNDSAKKWSMFGSFSNHPWPLWDNEQTCETLIIIIYLVCLILQYLKLMVMC